MLSRGPRARKEELWNRLVPVETREGPFPMGEEGIDE
jgi:hypothetical protein